MEQETSAVIDPITGEESAKASTESTGQGKDSAQASQEEKDIAGQPKGQTEDGKEEGTGERKQFRSKNQTIYELRQAVRERDERLTSFEKKLAQFEQQMQRLPQDQKPSRTFWEAPEDTIKAMMEENRKALLEEFNQTRLMDQKGVEWKQETSEAAKFIQGTKGITQEDQMEIAELIRSTPAMQNMRPGERAEYAMFLWQKSHGISDKSAIKSRAATVTGTPGTSAGRRTAADVEKDILSLPKDIGKWTPEDHKRYNTLEQEIKGMQSSAE